MWFCHLEPPAEAIAWLSPSDASQPLLGIYCERVPDAVREENGVSLARVFRLVQKIAEGDL